MRRRFGRARIRRRKAYALAAAAVSLAVGGLVLARSQGHARSTDATADTGAEDPGSRSTIDPPRVELTGPGVDGFMALTQGAVLSGGERRVFGELRLTANEEGIESGDAPVALAIALDTSGSMSGAKIRQARKAVLSLVDRMNAEDRVAVIPYTTRPSMLQKMASVGEVRSGLRKKVKRVNAGGGTEIPPALTLATDALSEVPNRFVRRVVLVSDGRDHSGITTAELNELVGSQAEQGTTSSSLGIGVDYDEEFLTTVADAGRGNYAFLEDGAELQPFLERELRQARRTVANNVVATLDLPEGWRVEKAHGAQLQGEQGNVRVPVGTLVAGQQRGVTLELAVDAKSAGPLGSAHVELAYRTTANQQRHALGGGALALHSVDDAGRVKDSRNGDLHAEALTTSIDAEQTEAVEAWSRGQQERADEMTNQHLHRLRKAKKEASSPEAINALKGRMDDLEQDKKKFQRLQPQSGSGKAFKLERKAEQRSAARVR